ncbi:FAD-dependent monooxygenase [Streptomyces noursei]|uniref:FAD-dependent monooxygenase n=1 Tax=Streptomyces noursei TaxID=1971 RepID=UPI001F041550|nr:FAD-dependent monooxygenase [Streptomyces noursei]
MRLVQSVEFHRRLHRGRRPDPRPLPVRSAQPQKVTGSGPLGAPSSPAARLAGFRYPLSTSRLATIAAAPTVVEKHSRAYVEKRQRAGAVDSRGVRLFREWGLADVVKDGSSPKEITGGTWLDGGMYPLGFEDVDTDAVFRPQQVLVRNLTDAFLEAGGDLRFEALDVSLAGIDSECPTVHYRNPDGTTTTVTCDFVAGCDGFHGVSRASVPAGQLTLARPATLPSSGRTSASGAN